MMTEDEAKTKWCPMARVALDYGEGSNGARAVLSANRGWADQTDHLAADSCCIGSACMMWSVGSARKLETAYGIPRPDGEWWELIHGSTDALSNTWRRIIPATGYCGLAGRPV